MGSSLSPSPPTPPGAPRPFVRIPPPAPEKPEWDLRRVVMIAIPAVLVVVLLVVVQMASSKANTLLLAALDRDIRLIEEKADPAVPKETIAAIQEGWRRMRTKVEAGDADLGKVAETRSALTRALADQHLDSGEAEELNGVAGKW